MEDFKLQWDEDGKRLYELGVDRGVIYPMVDGTYPIGEAWNGLTKVSEAPSGAEPTALWANNQKYGELLSAEQFGYTIEAYTYPDSFAQCNGLREAVKGVRVSQQTRVPFGMTYRNLIGNDTKGEAFGYRIHVVYGSKAKPASKDRSTTNDSPEAGTMAFECSTTPCKIKGFKPSAHIEIDSTTIDAEKLAAIEKVLYGTGDTEARLPLPDELLQLLGYTQAAG